MAAVRLRARRRCSAAPTWTGSPTGLPRASTRSASCSRRAAGSPSAPSTRASARAATARWRSTAAARTSSSPSSSRCTPRGTSSPRSRRSAARSTFGDGASPVRVVIDPIDGSLNARRTIPRPLRQHRGRLGPDDGRRRVRLRLRLRRPGGVRRRGAARARRSTAALAARGPATGSRSWASSRPSPADRLPVLERLAARRSGSGSSARSRSRSPTSPPAASTAC